MGMRIGQILAGAVILGIVLGGGRLLMRVHERAVSTQVMESKTADQDGVVEAGLGHAAESPAREIQQATSPERTDNVLALPSAESSDVLQALREKTLSGRHGSMPIRELIQALGDVSGGPEIQEIFTALVARKEEALPLVQEKLRTGNWWEKHMATKLLRYSPWPETYADLLALALSKGDHMLARQGALYALAALGNAEAGPQLLSILSESDCPQGVQLVAIAALGRLECTQAADAIRAFTRSEDLQIRIFANRSLAELGETADVEFLLSALDHADYLVRDEACGALGAVEGNGIAERLQALAADDPNEAVRLSAKESLLQREMRGQSQARKLEILSAALAGAESRLGVWILQAILDDCGPEGQAAVEELARREDRIGERAGTFLIWSGAR